MQRVLDERAVVDEPFDAVAHEQLALGGQLVGVPIEVAPKGARVSTDIGKLELAIVNLVANAIKYSDVDKSRRWVRISSETMPSGEVKIRVEDNGIGIEPRFQGKVFGLFDQLDPNAEGTGIGLALVKRIVEVHGGRIWIESEGEGSGSTFCFTIPVKG